MKKMMLKIRHKLIRWLGGYTEQYSAPVQRYNDALDAAKEAGWYSEPIKLADGSVNMIDYCPQCRERMEI